MVSSPTYDRAVQTSPSSLTTPPSCVDALEHGRGLADECRRAGAQLRRRAQVTAGDRPHEAEQQARAHEEHDDGDRSARAGQIGSRAEQGADRERRKEEAQRHDLTGGEDHREQDPERPCIHRFTEYRRARSGSSQRMSTSSTTTDGRPLTDMRHSRAAMLSTILPRIRSAVAAALPAAIAIALASRAWRPGPRGLAEQRPGRDARRRRGVRLRSGHRARGRARRVALHDRRAGLQRRRRPARRAARARPQPRPRASARGTPGSMPAARSSGSSRRTSP